MINEVFISDIASFNSQGVWIENLNKINFIYGGNGVGKTTVSNYFSSLINENSNFTEAFSECTSDYSSKEKVYVYNQRYYERLIVEKQMPGIFSIGDNIKEYEEELVEYKNQKDNNENKLETAKKKKEKKKENLEKIEMAYIDYLWNIYRDKDNDLFRVFDKVAFYSKGSKKTFYHQYKKDKNEYKNLSQNKKLSKEELLRQVDQVYFEKEIIKEPIKIFKYFIGKNEFDIFKEVIIGEEDLEFSEMINSLNLQNWVYQGKKIIEDSNLSKCPMCQRALSEEILNYIKDYFDNRYVDKMNELQNKINFYRKYYKELKDYILKIKENKDVNVNIVNKIELEVEKINRSNERIIEKKVNNPTSKEELKTFDDAIGKIEQEIAKANEIINKDNQIILDIENSKKKIEREAKKHFFNIINKHSGQYLKDMSNENKGIKGLRRQEKDLKQHINKYEKKIEKVNEKIASIEFTEQDINKQLKLYGFHNFRIQSNNDNTYSIIRENGEVANNSLSEGEKTFISFLYFYHRLLEKKDEDKIVVIDDPISSLDSSILYVVSSIIKQLISDRERLNIKQLFIFTHNTYFHKEITFKSIKEITNYYILRKNKGISYIESYEKNPITSSYELLWKELNDAKSKPSSFVPNTMRRILEEYFEFLGNKKLDQLVEDFEESERLIVDSLIKFTHDGSHRIKEDLYVEQSDEIYRRYYEVFEKIFEVNEQHAHYKMMMETVNNEE